MGLRHFDRGRPSKLPTAIRAFLQVIPCLELWTAANAHKLSLPVMEASAGSSILQVRRPIELLVLQYYRRPTLPGDITIYRQPDSTPIRWSVFQSYSLSLVRSTVRRLLRSQA